MAPAPAPAPFQFLIEAAAAHAAARKENPTLALAGLPRPAPKKPPEIPPDQGQHDPPHSPPPAMQGDLARQMQQLIPDGGWIGKERTIYAIPESGFAEMDLVHLLPTRPYCTNDLESGLRIRTRNHAIKHLQISVNSPWVIKALIFDIDQGDLSAAQWLPLNLQPTWTTINPASGNCHFSYVLTCPVNKRNPRSVKYLSACMNAMREIFAADLGYAGLITHNPLRYDHWSVQWSGKTYSLADLAYPAFQQATPKIKQNRNSVVANVADSLAETVAPTHDKKGNRNSTLFECARNWSYEGVRAFRGKDFSDFFRETWDVVEQMASCIPKPLTASQIRSVATSVARWTWQRDPEAWEKFRCRQSWKGSGGRDPAKASKLKSENWRSGPGPGRPRDESPRPWDALGISRRTYYRRGLHLDG